MAKKPLTQRELKKELDEKNKIRYTTILNCCKQAIPVQLKSPKGVDFFVGEQTIPIYPGKTAKLPTSRLYDEQIKNHQKAGRLRIVSTT